MKASLSERPVAEMAKAESVKAESVKAESVKEAQVCCPSMMLSKFAQHAFQPTTCLHTFLISSISTASTISFLNLFYLCASSLLRITSNLVERRG